MNTKEVPSREETSPAWLGTPSEQSGRAQSDSYFLGHMNILEDLQDPEIHQYSTTLVVLSQAEKSILSVVLLHKLFF